MYLARTLESKILQYNKQFKIISLMGQRQIGKTTLLRNIAEKNKNFLCIKNTMFFFKISTAKLIY